VSAGSPFDGGSTLYSRDRLFEDDRLAPDGQVATCYRTRFRDWMLYGWTDRTGGLALCYQLEPIAQPPEP